MYNIHIEVVDKKAYVEFEEVCVRFETFELACLFVVTLLKETGRVGY
jgi:hypothetical protein